MHKRPSVSAPRSGFTLIELLVVVAIIAVLISILLPSLAQARAQGKATQCGTNLHHVGQAMHTYLAENRGIFPTAYIYASDPGGGYDIMNQDAAHPFGYLHWSWFLYSRGQASDKAFQCPEMPHGGAPRTNPGPRQENWESGQVDQNGQSSATSTSLEDKQAPRMAYTGNAAVFPRNKFTTVLSNGPRINRYVGEGEIENPGNVILATEFRKKWQNVAVGSGSSLLVKSHRPVNPFYHIGSGTDEYAASPQAPGFQYGPVDDQVRYGIQREEATDETTGLIEGSAGTEVNAVGRHHPGQKDELGGAANFLFVDSHIERRTILQTMRDRKWGAKYYSISGRNEVINRYGQILP